MNSRNHIHPSPPATIFLAMVTSSIFSTFCVAQTNTGRPFYDHLTNYYVAHPVVDSTPRSGHEKLYDRAVQIWAPRLWPHGDFSIAANAMTDYAQTFGTGSSPCPPATVQWEMLGPVGHPADGGNGTSAIGVGQIHRITFDPGYNGTSNSTIYATSSFGGLWRSDDDAMSWSVVGTDEQLPLTSVADVAINFSNPNDIFICTGNADGGIEMTASSNTAGIDPLYTIGVYRSQDRGDTWDPINDGFLSVFTNGGVTRRMIIDPSNSNNLYVATSSGVMKCNNALAATPNWQQSNTGIDPNELDIRGLEFMPGSSTTLYASGKDIYRSLDGGNSWLSMTGLTTGLELSALPGFEVNRINIAVTPDAPLNLYAYIVGSDQLNNNNQVCYIYAWDGLQWDQLHYQETTSAFTQISGAWMPIAVSPVDDNMVFFGHTVVKGDRDISTPNFSNESNYNSNNCHADIHALAFQPNTSNPKLFAGHDGGISVKTISGTSPQTNDWQWRNNGLAVKTIWSYGASNIHKDVMIIGSQDTGSDIYKPIGNQKIWENVGGGDGYGAQVLNMKEKHLICLENTIFMKRIDHTTNSVTYEDSFLPFDPLHPNERAWKPKTFQVVEHPDLTNPWVGFTELYERIKQVPTTGDAAMPSNVWTLQSDISKVPAYDPQWIRQLTEFAIAESDPNVIYATQGGLDAGPNGLWVEPFLMRSVTGGNDGDYSSDHFVEITSNLPNMNIGNLSKPIVTGIAIDPSNANRVWLSFTGYDPDVKVFQTIDGGNTWTDADPNNSLANLPVNGIVYQSGTNDRLYIATDAGVYYTENGMDCWARYGDIPNTRVVELRINQCSGKLTAATFGRGIWRSDLLPVTTSLAHNRVVDSDEIWMDEEFIHGNVLVTNGAKLTVRSTLHFPKYGKLVVHAGATLVLDGGTLTNSCDQLWDGVQVHGNLFEPQSPITNSLQGRVVMLDGAMIEHARTAVLLADGDPDRPTGPIIKESTGGIIRATNATFRNNVYDVVFRNYVHRDANNDPVPNRSRFKTCTFVTDGPLVDVTRTPAAHIYLDNVHGVNFSGCDWIKHGSTVPFSEVWALGSGIRSINSSFTVAAACQNIQPVGYPCPPNEVIKSSFTGLLYGVNANGFDMSRTISIDQADFNMNIAGVRMENIMEPSITRCNFDAAEPGLSGWIPSPYGIYADQCTGFEIEENSFTTSQPGGDYQKVGLVIKDSGEDPNRYYNNAFDGLHCGTIIQGNNGDGTTVTSGLQFKCNDHGDQGNAENTYDIAITGPDPTVSLEQGTDADVESPAGNTFSQACSTNDNDIHVDATGAPLPMFTYVHHDLGSPFNIEPTCYSPPISVPWIQEAVGLPYQSKEIACPSDLGRDRVKSASKQLALDAEADLQLSLAAYQSAKDDGDTEGLHDIINEATTSLDIRNPMLNVAPEIGVECFKLAFERLYDPLTPYHLTQVLVANSPLQGEVLDMTYSSDLDEVYLTMVDQAQGGDISILDLLEGEQSEFAHIKAEHLGDLVRNTLLDTIDIDLDSLRLFYDQPGMGNELRLAALEQAKGDAVALYDVAERNLQLDHYSELFRGLQKLALAEQAEGWDEPDAITLNWLYAMAEQREITGSAFAQAWLNALGEDQPEEIIILPDPFKSFQASQHRGSTPSDQPLLLLFPNPAADDGFRAAYRLPDDLPNAELTFRDMLGRTIWTYRSGTGVQLVDVPVHQLPDGLYFCSLVVDDAPLVTEKLMIAR